MPKSAITSTAEGQALRETAKRWLSRIEDASRREKTWRDDADVATKVYTGEGARAETSEARADVSYDYNMLFANVETIVPAVINSPPAPDVRRRFGSDDPVGKDFAEILERSIRVQVDDGRLQSEIEAMAQDGFLAGRGVIRLRFRSEFTPDEADAADPNAEPSGTISNERITFEAVSWKDCVHGPAKRWEDVPWWAFRHAMEGEDYDGLADAALVRSQVKPEEQADDDADRIVWEIWDKRSRQVLFVREKDDGQVVKQVADPLGLSAFFPIATPVQPIEVNGRLMPVNPFSIYRRLADELDVTTKRIRVITKQLKVKGFYAFDPTVLQAVLDADDNEFVPVPDAQEWAARGGLEAAVMFWPVEKLILVLTQLFAQREQTKQAIYEITGISDIVRGASKANETLGAQQIKSQWGSLRIQKMQRMMERAARDLFLMMSEVIPAKFSFATLQRMTEIQIEPSAADLQPVPMPPPPQPGVEMPPEVAQQAEQAQAAEQARQAKLQHLEALQKLMGERASTYYRIDVETDSTVKADLTRQKAEATEFMTAASGYFAAVAPLVQQQMLPMEIAVEIFASFSRMFNLGKSVEDALDELVGQAKGAAGQPQGENPAQAAAKADADAKVQAAQLDMKLKAEDGERQAQVGAVDLETKQIEQDIRRHDLTLKDLQVQNAEAELAVRRRALTQPLAPALGGFGG